MAKDPNSWCHFSQLTQRIPTSYFAKTPVERDVINEKFAYLVVQKGKVMPSDMFKNEDQARNSVEKSYFWPRIIRPLIKKQ